ncbi:hypothetical protein Pan97_04700 [Bremerella volcania]|uniref:Toprim domain-containing protein n=1 Tax=Bremerella volcania TaxID=2527984 RepID=A0A518C2P1_9BACT|nr:YfjI family protein [Bremerella volcania]QDU73497.1 hypothetical protein Pan97_04700 [Bremerella volcania]
MTPVNLVLSSLKNVKKTKSGWQAHCPAHSDQHSSLSVTEGEDGRALIHCHADCPPDQVCASMGLQMSDLMPNETEFNPSKKPDKGKIVKTYAYEDEAGKLLMESVRYENKTFRQRKPDGHDGWDWTVKGVRVVPFRLPQLLANPDASVFIVEGEKDVHSLEAIGLVATCNAGGAGKWNQEHAQFLQNRDVIILPDNDEAGEKHAEKVAQTLVGLARSIKLIHLPGLPLKGDVSDWIESGGTDDKLAELVQESEIWQPQQVAYETGDSLDFEPFPIEFLPEPVCSFVRDGARAIGCDEVFLALPLLSALASAIGDSRCLRLKDGWEVLPILWTAVVGESGTAKTPAFKAALSAVRTRENENLEEYDGLIRQHEDAIAIYDKQFQKWKKGSNADELPPVKPVEPQATRHIVDDTTLEALVPILKSNPRGLLLARDELSGWLSSFDRYTQGKGGGDAARYLSMHTGGEVTIDRKSGIPKTLRVPRSIVSITGGIQPAVLKKTLGRDHFESGMAARFLLSHPPRRAKKWTETGISYEQQQCLSDVFDRLYSLEPEIVEDVNRDPAVITLSKSVKSLYTTFYDRHAKEQSELSGELASAWSKLEEYAARLALVIHCVRWAAKDANLKNDRSIDGDTLCMALELTEWFKHETRRVYQIMAESQSQREERALVDWIKRRGNPITARQARQSSRRFETTEDAESALDNLARKGLGSWEQSSIGNTGGRPTRYFSLN